MAAYGMEETSGTTVADASGRGHTGVARNVTRVAGRHGDALSFNGSDSWVTITDAPALRLSTAMTVSAWVKPEDVADWRAVVTRELEEATSASYALYASDGTVPTGWLQTDTDGWASTFTVDGTSALPINAWTHIAVTYDGSTARLYVNGQQAAQEPVTGDLYYDAGALRIGGNEIWGEFFDGVIDEAGPGTSAIEIGRAPTVPIFSVRKGCPDRSTVTATNIRSLQHMKGPPGLRPTGM
nr:LamG domain-containing protein [Nonomuraea aridisoli]